MWTRPRCLADVIIVGKEAWRTGLDGGSGRRCGHGLGNRGDRGLQRGCMVGKGVMWEEVRERLVWSLQMLPRSRCGRLLGRL